MRDRTLERARRYLPLVRQLAPCHSASAGFAGNYRDSLTAPGAACKSAALFIEIARRMPNEIGPVTIRCRRQRDLVIFLVQSLPVWEYSVHNDTGCRRCDKSGPSVMEMYSFEERLLPGVVASIRRPRSFAGVEHQPSRTRRAACSTVRQRSPLRVYTESAVSLCLQRRGK
jgi:hypothetical protein